MLSCLCRFFPRILLTSGCLCSSSGYCHRKIWFVARLQNWDIHRRRFWRMSKSACQREAVPWPPCLLLNLPATAEDGRRRCSVPGSICMLWERWCSPASYQGRAETDCYISLLFSLPPSFLIESCSFHLTLPSPQLCHPSSLPSHEVLWGPFPCPAALSLGCHLAL